MMYYKVVERIIHLNVENIEGVDWTSLPSCNSFF